MRKHYHHNINKTNKGKGESHPVRLNLCIVGMVVVFGVLFGMKVMMVGKIATLGEKMRTFDQQKTQLTQDIQMMKGEIAQLGSLSRIEKIARDELGMIPVSEPLLFLDISTNTPQLAHN